MYKLFTEAITESLQEHWNDITIESYSSNEKMTGCALASEITALIDYWGKLGITDGSKIAICAPSGLNWTKIFLAASCSNYIVVALPNDIESAILAAQHSDCDVMYMQSSDYQLINTRRFSNLDYVISIENNDVLWSSIPTSVQYKPIRLLHIGDLKKQQHSQDDLALIIYTSGTSTRIKGVMLSYKNISSCMWANYSRFPYANNESYLSLLPLNHIFGLMHDLLLPICKGMRVVILDRPPVPEYVIPAIKYTRPVLLFAIPLVFYKLMDEINETNAWDALSSCKMIICGGSGVQKAFCEWMTIKRNLPFSIGYGMSECSPTICAANNNSYEMYSCGQPLDCLEFRIDSDEPTHIPGEILVRGDSVFMGYYKDDSLTQSVFTKDGWFKTGDIAIQSEKGNVFLCGRKDSQLSADSGKNIFIEDIEDKLRESTYIQDAVLILNGNRLKAIIVPKDIKHKSLIRNYINEVNKHLSQGVYISDIQYEDHIERTDKGTIKRSLYI